MSKATVSFINKLRILFHLQSKLTREWRKAVNRLSSAIEKNFISELDFYRLIPAMNLLQGFWDQENQFMTEFCYENFLKYLLERCVSEKLNKCDFKNIKKFHCHDDKSKTFIIFFWNSLTECVRWQCKIFSLIQRRKTFISRLTRNRNLEVKEKCNWLSC